MAAAPVGRGGVAEADPCPVVEQVWTEKRMSDVKVEHKSGITRSELAQWMADLGKELSGAGTVSFRLAESTVELGVPDDIRFEAEVEVDGDTVELEIELKWSTARRPARTTGNKGSPSS